MYYLLVAIISRSKKRDKGTSHESGFVCTTRFSQIRRAFFNGGLISESKDIYVVYRLSKNKL